MPVFGAETGSHVHAQVVEALSGGPVTPRSVF